MLSEYGIEALVLVVEGGGDGDAVEAGSGGDGDGSSRGGVDGMDSRKCGSHTHIIDIHFCHSLRL